MFKAKPGDYGKKIGLGNIEKVRKWLEDNPDGTQAECADECKISRNTVNKIAKKLRENKGK